MKPCKSIFYVSGPNVHADLCVYSLVLYSDLFQTVYMNDLIPNRSAYFYLFFVICTSFIGEVINTYGPIEPDKDNIRKEPYSLPHGFTWDALDLSDRSVVSKAEACID